jgi:glycosyltransferase involved in cell wall biosynthesis
MFRLLGEVYRRCPCVLLSYLTVPNILAAACRLLLPRIRVIWGIRNSFREGDLRVYDWTARWLFRIQRSLARVPDLIVFNSYAGLRAYREERVPFHRYDVIPNGIDVLRFSPCPRDRNRVREEWGVPQGRILVGIVGRFDPKKDHETFLRAAALLKRRVSGVSFVCVGGGDPERKTALVAQAKHLGLDGDIRWVPAKPDVDAVIRALDILVVSSSMGEGFSNVLAEALATGVPCVSTDVGDAARILAGVGRVVRPGDAAALAEATAEMIRLRSQELSVRARLRVVNEYSIERLVERTVHAMDVVWSGRGPRTH